MTQLILFDCDGTLMDSNKIIILAMQKAFNDHGLIIPCHTDVLAFLGMSLDAVIAALIARQDDRQAANLTALVADIAQAYRQHYGTLEADICLYPRVLDVLQILKERGYSMAIVTGKSRSGLLRVIERFDLKQYFFIWRTADCCHSKPHPAMALECMAELGIDAAKTTLVGDSHFDIQMAKAAGVRALGVSFDSECAQALYDEGADKVLGKFEDLLECFPQLS